MPCTITGSFEGDRALYAEEAADRLRNKVIKLTDLLCVACRRLEKDDEFAWPEKLSDWWTAHKANDARLAREKRAKKGRK